MGEKEPKAKKMNTLVRFTSADEYIGRPPFLSGSGGVSEADEVSKMEAEDMAKKKRKLRALEMDTYIAGKEVELKKNQAAIAAAGTPTTALAIPPQQMAMTTDVLEALSKMPDEQRQKIVTSVMMMNMGQGKMDPAPMIWMWPMMSNVGKQNPLMS